jgi:hypothetical protein
MTNSTDSSENSSAPDVSPPDEEESLRLTPTLVILGLLALGVGLGAGLVMSSLVWK